MPEPIRASDLHELTDGEQVGHSDVITAQEGLSAQKHGLHLLQSVIELRQSTNQTHLVHRRTRLSREEHLRQTGGDREKRTYFIIDLS